MRASVVALLLGLAGLFACAQIVGIHDLVGDTCDLNVHVDKTSCGPCAVGVQWTLTDSNGQSFSSVVSSSDPTPAPESPAGSIVVTISQGDYTMEGSYYFTDGGTSSSTSSGKCTAEAGSFMWTCACAGDGGN